MRQTADLWESRTSAGPSSTVGANAPHHSASRSAKGGAQVRILGATIDPATIWSVASLGALVALAAWVILRELV